MGASRAGAFQDSRPTPAPDAPATSQAAGSESMTVIITDIVGMVQVSEDGKSWKRAEKGMRLGEGASFRTGLKSSVTCVIPPDQTFKLDTLGTITVSEALRKGNKVRTELIMKYGAASYGIEAAGAEHDSIIRTPGNTLAVRGTQVRISDRPGFPTVAESYTGRALFRTARGATFVGGKGYARVRSDQGNAAETALKESVVDPAVAQARTDSDRQLIALQTSKGAILSFDRTANIAVVRGGAGAPSDAELSKFLPGRLDFVLRWSGNADLNLLASDVQGDATKILANSAKGINFSEVLFPGFGLNVSKSGGTIPYDHRGGPNGGIEIAYWKDSFPNGLYGLSVLHNSGASADYKLDAFLDGKPLNLFFFGVDNTGTPGLVKSHTETGTISLNNDPAPPSALVLVPPSAFFDDDNVVPPAAPPAGQTGSAVATRKIAPTNRPADLDRAAASQMKAETYPRRTIGTVRAR
jgi:hypothetical protein